LIRTEPNTLILQQERDQRNHQEKECKEYAAGLGIVGCDSNLRVADRPSWRELYHVN
jgi:hypothetical protein